MLRHAAAREHPFKCATPVVKLKTIFRKIDDRFCDVKFKIDNRFHLLRRHRHCQVAALMSVVMPSEFFLSPVWGSMRRGGQAEAVRHSESGSFLSGGMS
jgi:hypothetical protein